MIFDGLHNINEANSDKAKSKRADAVMDAIALLRNAGFNPKVTKSEIDKFSKGEKTEFGDSLCISNLKNPNKACRIVNPEIKKYGARLKADNYGTAFLSIKEEHFEEESLEMPDEEANAKLDIQTLLDNADPKRIFLSSDWHFFKNHYKKERNYVNTQKIVTWCRQNIKENDIFMYLGDISFRYANAKDKAESARILKSLPGIKILVLGNHDRMAGDEYYTSCGFDYVFEEITWKNLIFTHRPVNMALYPDDYLNIHGHIHSLKMYNTTDGKRNINVYPYFYGNKPVTLDYCLNHVEELTKDNYWNTNSMLGEQQVFYVPARGMGRMSMIHKMNEAYIRGVNESGPARVYYSPNIDSTTIAYLVSMFKERVNGKVAIKLHVGEEGNNFYLKPNLLKQLVKHIDATLVDSNVIYDSVKQTTKGHLDMAKKHGFLNVANMDILDADGDDIVLSIPASNKINKELENMKVPGYVSKITKGPHLKDIHVGSHLANYDSMIVFTHFKGHSLAGFGGSIKNIGMGVPSAQNGKPQIHNGEFKWGADFLERLVESASAIQDYFEGNIIYVNVLKNITTKCDCEKHVSHPTIPDIGVLVSNDIVALEQASLDFIRTCPGNREIMDVISSRAGTHQIEYAEFLGMGSREYKLYSVDNKRIRLENGAVVEMKRSNLKDSDFGIPEDRKYPLDTEKHVQSAIKLFGHAEESKKKELAKRISNAARRYDISIPENTQCYKYLNESVETLFPSEVNTVIFDMGSVLVNAHTKETILNCPDIPDEYTDEIYDLITKRFFYEKEKPEISSYDVAEAKRYFAEIAPAHILQYVDIIFSLFLPAMYKYDYVDEMLKQLRSKGYKLYYLSNWDKYSLILEREFFEPLLAKFDGGIFSCDIGIEKPDRKIYEALINKYGLEANKCIFFDDKVENIEAAINVGMHGIVFNENTTPHMILDPIPMVEDAHDSILVDTGEEIITMKNSDINHWYICSVRHPSYIDKDLYCKTIEQAIEQYVKSEEFAKAPAVEKYIFIWGGEYNDEHVPIPVCVGKILIYENFNYEWLVQYPINKDGESYTGVLNEWSMAAVNPIKGITKPFILKVCKNNSVLDPKQYAFSPDIISDKYLVINENAKLEVVDASYFDEYFIEEYEYIGNKYNLKKISEAYNNGITVDNTFFYTALTGKPMLTEDQIDFDKSFKKVDFELLHYKSLSEIVTLRDKIIESMGYKFGRIAIDESVIANINPNISKYLDNGFVIKEDFDGFYIMNEMNYKRSVSVPVASMLTESMVKSIF